MSTKALLPPFPIDKTLTPVTARQRGYVLICIAFPDFVEENRELIATLLENGCVLGVGSASNQDDTVGIYQPLVQQDRLDSPA